LFRVAEMFRKCEEAVSIANRLHDKYVIEYPALIAHMEGIETTRLAKVYIKTQQQNFTSNHFVPFYKPQNTHQKHQK